MSRLLLLAFLAASIVHAAPASKTKELVYFPTKVGDTRVYEVRAGEKIEVSYTEIVTKVEAKDETIHVTVTRSGASVSPGVTTIGVSREGLFRITPVTTGLEKPTLLLKMPAKVGTKWESEGVTYSIIKEEEVEVPAGRIHAIRVESDSDTNKIFLWFAPGIGLIKMANQGIDRVQVLKEFKAAK